MFGILLSMKAMIVDDELHARENLQIMLTQTCAEIKEIKLASNVDQAITINEHFQPDVVFLDIQMPGGNGFEFVNSVDVSDFALVFVTAHDEYALPAIKAGTIDYLLKPIDRDELKMAMLKVHQSLKQRMQTSSAYQESLIDVTTNYQKGWLPRKICLSHSSKIQLVDMDDIVYLKSESNYTTFHFIESPDVVMSKTMGYYEDILGERFLRIHRSYLVNLDYIQELHYESSRIVLTSGKVIPVSRRKLALTVQSLKSHV